MSESCTDAESLAWHTQKVLNEFHEQYSLLIAQTLTKAEGEVSLAEKEMVEYRNNLLKHLQEHSNVYGSKYEDFLTGDSK